MPGICIVEPRMHIGNATRLRTRGANRHRRLLAQCQTALQVATIGVPDAVATDLRDSQ